MENLLANVNEYPTYTQFSTVEFFENPIVEALTPPPKDNCEALERMTRRPLFFDYEVDLPVASKLTIPSRMSKFFFPVQKHVTIFNRIYAQLLEGYCGRNPMTVEGQRYLHGLKKRSEEIENKLIDISQTDKETQIAKPVKAPPSQKDFLDEDLIDINYQRQRDPKISFLTGFSGMGKSTLIDMIMKSFGKQVIVHKNYQGKPFTETQITHLRRNVPDQCSAKNICKSFGDLVDQLLGIDLHSSQFKSSKANRTHYVAALQRIIANYHIGALVIDELQNVSLAKSGGKEEFLAFLINLRDELKIPIILVGTYKSASILRGDDSLARRLTEGGFYELKRPLSPADEDFKTLCEITWSYQWIKNPYPFCDEVLDTLYMCSQGVTGIMLNLYSKTLETAILNDIHTIKPQMIESVFKTEFPLQHKFIELFKKLDPALFTDYEDFFLQVDQGTKAPPSISTLDKILENFEQVANKTTPQNTDKGIIKRTNKKLFSSEKTKNIINDCLAKSDEIMGKL